ncbi:hypothetical protein niasHS_002561 [Heterodera schachtii]|uniref:Peptidase M12B domain-containing protein n=1 Tax=Heterodera schachtii TaxID=97005 RepID=A0ABD2KL81_HETSC
MPSPGAFLLRVLLRLLLLLPPHLWAIHRTFTVSELRHTFGVERHELVPEYNLLSSIKRERSSDGLTRRIHFRAWNSSFLVELRPNDRLISPHLISVVRHANRTVTHRGLPHRPISNCHFHGRVLSHGGFRAAISDCHRLMGIIVQEDHFVILQTVPERMRRKKRRRKRGDEEWENGEEYLVYRRKEMDEADFGKWKRTKRKSERERPPQGDEGTADQRETGKRVKDEWPMWKIVEEGKRAEEEKTVKKGKTVEERKRAEEEEEKTVKKGKTVEESLGQKFELGQGDGGENAEREAAAAEDGQLFCDVSNNGTLSLLPAELANYTLPSAANLNSLFIFPQLDPITLEIGLFLDSMLFEHFQREFTAEPEQHLTDFSLALINNVHVLYQQPSLSPNLDIVIVHFELWISQPAHLATEVHRNGQAQSLLDAFCRHQARINPATDLTDPNHWDHAVLLTGYDIYHTTSSVAGVAPVGRMCDELFACSLVEGLHLGRSFVLAHEMGHNMGMVHDGVQNQCGRSCCLMSAVNGAGKTTWSSCSVREFNSFLLQLDESGRGNCLRDPAESIASHDHLKDGRLPGQRSVPTSGEETFKWKFPTAALLRTFVAFFGAATVAPPFPPLTPPWRAVGADPNGGATVGNVKNGTLKWATSQLKWTEDGPIGLRLRSNHCLGLFCYDFGPNNGGRPCEGSNVRGVVCGGSRSLCEGFTRKEFGDRICSAIRHDQLRPDKQLSGHSFLHQSQPCKIWCHVRDSELIRNKGQFPNGSPCGPNHFCVGGVCLMLGCDGRALVQNSSDCPSDSAELSFITSGDTLRKHSTKSEKWDQWGQWSDCSATCGNFGVQKRTRKCRFPVASECAGKDSEVRACESTPPKCEGIYGEWTGWSECEGKCGEMGKRRRRRKCQGDERECTEPTEETVQCRRLNCAEWSLWGEWTECVGKCGEEGEMSRERKCSMEEGAGDAELGCGGQSVQRERCNDTKCELSPVNDGGQWGEWQPCSVSCGIGFQFRERLCADGPCANSGKQARTCNVQDCSRVLGIPVWSEWSLWSVCSRTCGQGIQQRFRRCLNGLCPPGEALREQKRCVLGPCPQWSNWSQWTNCASCSVFETRKRHRQCVVKVATADGQQEETELGQEACNSAGAPIEFDNCERFCAENEIAKVRGEMRSQSNGNESLAEKGTEWGEWSPCSVSCGEGIRRKERKCEMGETGECKTGGGDGTAEEKCRGQKCAEETAEKAEREASSSSVRRFPTWSDWSEWSACSCFSLTRYRRRFCRVHDPQLKGFCVGSIIDQSPCIPPDLPTSPEGKQCVAIAGSWSAWSEWSACSQDCGTRGHRIRNRMCANPLPSNRGSYCVGLSFDQIPCDYSVTNCRGDPIDGRWTEWSEWSQCSNPCANGQRSRTRHCSDPRPENGGKQCSGTDFEMQACSEPVLCLLSQSPPLTLSANASSPAPSDFSSTLSRLSPQWGPWSPWSNCTSTCGFALRRRFRLCELSHESQLSEQKCEGIAQMTAMCDTPFSCPNDTAVTDGRWSEWGEWSNNCEWATCKESEPKERDGTAQKGAKAEEEEEKQQEDTPTEEGEEREGEQLEGHPMALARELRIRTRTRFCAAPSAGGSPCFGPSSQRIHCPPPTKCDSFSTSIFQLISNIWQMDVAIIRRMINF